MGGVSAYLGRFNSEYGKYTVEYSTGGNYYIYLILNVEKQIDDLKIITNDDNHCAILEVLKEELAKWPEEINTGILDPSKIELKKMG